MVIAEPQVESTSEDLAIIAGGVRSGRTDALISLVVDGLADRHERGDRRPAFIAVSRSARQSEVEAKCARLVGAADHGADAVRVVTMETIARSMVQAHGDVVGATSESVLGTELARRTLVVEALGATELLSPWPLSVDELLSSAIRVIDRLAEAGITVAVANEWQTEELGKLERRRDVGSSRQPTLLEVARRRRDLLAIATTYERLKREGGFLDRSDVFRRAIWLAKRGFGQADTAEWSALAVNDLDRLDGQERQLLDGLFGGGARLVAATVRAPAEAGGWSIEGDVIDLGPTATPADPIEAAFLAGREAGDDAASTKVELWPGVRAEVFVDEAAEEAWVAESIGKAVGAGVDPAQIAVIVMADERLSSVERRLLDRSIPCTRIAQPLLSGSTATGDLLAVADLLVDQDDPVAATRLGRSPRYVSSRTSARGSTHPHGRSALVSDVAKWRRTAANRGPQHALVEALRDLGNERVLAISSERWAVGELRALRTVMCHLDDPRHSQVTRSPETFRIALRSLFDRSTVGQEAVDSDALGRVTVLAAGDAIDSGPWAHLYLVGVGDEAVDAHHRLEDETADPASLPLGLLSDPLEVPLGAGGRTVEVLGRRMRRRREDRLQAWLIELARKARVTISLSHAATPPRTAEVHETVETESRLLDALRSAGLPVRRSSSEREVETSLPARVNGSRPLAPPRGTSLLLIDGGIDDAIASHPESNRLRSEVAELVAYLEPGPVTDVGFAPTELSARELFLAEVDPDRYIQEVMLDLPDPPSPAVDRTARLRAWLEHEALRRTDREGLGVLVADGSTSTDVLEEMARIRGVDDRDLDLPGIGSNDAVEALVASYRRTPYGSMILNDSGRSLTVISRGRLTHTRLFGVVDQPDGLWQVIDVRVGAATDLDWYRLGVQALALSSPSRSLGCCRLVVVGLDAEDATIEVKPSPTADHLSRRLALQWQIVDLVGS